MSAHALGVDEVLKLLVETPPRLAALAADRPPAQLRARPAPDAWSATDILAHLRACADVWGDAIATILATETPTIRAINPRTWLARTDYVTLDFAPSLAAFTAQRAALLATLTVLSPVEWERQATVTGTGTPRTWTVLTYAGRLARHEQSHVKQIGRLLAR